MCKFCDGKSMNIMNYDNHRFMNISYGQYQGVNINANLYMIGNMLCLGAGGSYRSNSDCYYEDCGVECDNKHSNNGQDEILKLEYCPFCGKKLESHEFELEHAHRIKVDLQQKIEQQKLEIEFCAIFFSVEAKYKYDPDHDNFQDKKPITKTNNYKVSLSTAKPDHRYIHNIKEIEYYTIDTPIIYTYGSNGIKYSTLYLLKDEVYKELVDKHLIEADDKLFNKILKKRKEEQQKLNKLINKMKELNEYIESLK